MIRRILVALFLSLLAVPARSMTDTEIQDCMDFDECALVSRPTKAIGVLLALLIAVLGGCGSSDPCPVEPQMWTELGIGIYVEEGSAEWTRAPDLSDRVDQIAGAIAEYSEHDPIEFSGIVVVLRSAETVPCGNFGQRNGCTHSDWIDLGAGGEWANEQFVPLLGHEFLHVMIGDRDHLSPLWSNLWPNCLSRIQ